MLWALETHLSLICMPLALSGCFHFSGLVAPVVPLPPPHPANLLAAPPQALWKQYDDFISTVCDNGLS